MVTLLNNILGEHKTKISNVDIIPSVDGVFDISIDDELVFSRKTIQNRMPEENEIETIISERLKKIKK